MSRTRKGSKGPGHEYAGKRPERYWHFPPGRAAKKWTHRAERRTDSVLPPLYGVCPWCGHDYPLGEDGRFVGHLRDRDGDGGKKTHCPGSGLGPPTRPA